MLLSVPGHRCQPSGQVDTEPTVDHSSGTTSSLKTESCHPASRFKRAEPSRLAGLVHLGKEVALCRPRAGLTASPAT